VSIGSQPHVEPASNDDRIRRDELPAIRALIAAMVAGGMHDPAHSELVVHLAGRVAAALNADEQTARDARQLASLLDLGKLGMPHELLDKREPLDATERQLLCQHPTVGARILSALPELARLAPALAAGHERWDGLGYPTGLRAEEIPLASRIVFVCDAYAAMTEERPYRPALTPEAAVQVVRHNAGEQFCPDAAGALISVLRQREPETRAAIDPVRDHKPFATIDQVGHALAEQRRGRAKLDRRAELSKPKVPLVVWIALAVVGIAVGCFIALPLPDLARQCPPGDGQGSCELQGVWLPAIFTIVLVPVGFVLAGLAVTRLPNMFRKWRRGELHLRVKLEAEESDDPLLVAASWGLVMRDAHAPSSEPTATKPEVEDTI
jgi:hypothetical protein